MKKHCYIITGTSRGIGEALVRSIMGAKALVFCIARNDNPGLHVEANVKGLDLREVSLDLCDTQKIGAAMKGIFRQVDAESVESITLINNAGTIHPIRQIGDREAREAILRSVTVNLSAAMLITDHFVRETEEWTCPRRVVNLSTGASKRAVPGWSAYCSAKAGLRMYAHCLMEEQTGRENPVKVLSFAPGVVDTEMQAEIRHAEPDAFPELEKFKNLKTQGTLISPGTVADKLLELIHAPNFGEQLEVDVRDLL